MSHSYWSAEKISSARSRVLEEDNEEGWSWRANVDDNAAEKYTALEVKKEEPTQSQETAEELAEEKEIQKLAEEFVEDLCLDDGASSARELLHDYWTAEKINAATWRETVEDDESVCSWRACDLQDDGTPVLVGSGSPIDDDPVFKDTTTFPLKLVGLLLFTNSGTHYSGTAFLVNNSTLLTAGHNIFLKGDPQISQNIAWIPGFSLTNQNPFGVFDGIQEKVVTSPKWDGDSANSSPYDYAIIHLKPNEKGQTPFDVLGGLLTLETAEPQNQTQFTEVGFYKTSPLQTNTGQFLGLLDNARGSMTVKNGSLPRGASGGPWLMSSDLGKVNGLTSKGNEVKEKSPLFNEELINFVKANSI